jgi:hypothetical protein
MENRKIEEGSLGVMLLLKMVKLRSNFIYHRVQYHRVYYFLEIKSYLNFLYDYILEQGFDNFTFMYILSRNDFLYFNKWILILKNKLTTLNIS